MAAIKEKLGCKLGRRKTDRYFMKAFMGGIWENPENCAKIRQLLLPAVHAIKLFFRRKYRCQNFLQNFRPLKIFLKDIRDPQIQLFILCKSSTASDYCNKFKSNSATTLPWSLKTFGVIPISRFPTEKFYNIGHRTHILSRSCQKFKILEYLRSLFQ